MKISEKQAIAKRDYYRANPMKFFTEVLDVKSECVWEAMEIIGDMVRDERKIVIKAGHSVSKSYTVARVVLWFLYCHKPSTVITTAPTFTQVEQILWREIHAAHANARVKLGGKLTTTSLDLSKTVAGKQVKWFALGISTRPDTAQENATKMQGHHNKYVLIVFDEADGVEPAIWGASDALLTSEGAKFLAIGNPLRPQSNFADCFKDHSYTKYTISVKDTPNFIEGREIIPGLSGRQYEEDMRRKWGEDSDMYRSRVLGEIPNQDPDSIVAVSWYERAEGARLNDVSGVTKRFLTVDVADGGNNESVVKGWANKTQTHEWRYPGKRADEIDACVMRNLREIEGNCIIYDHDGCGRILGGLLEAMKEKDSNIEIIPFEGGAEAYIDRDYTNRRSEAHHMMHKDFKDGKISVMKHNEKARRDITGIKWDKNRKGNKHGKIDVEAKIDFKKRLPAGESPDDGDCIMMMCGCYDDVPAISVKDMYVSKRRRRRTKSWKVA